MKEVIALDIRPIQDSIPSVFSYDAFEAALLNFYALPRKALKSNAEWMEESDNQGTLPILRKLEYDSLNEELSLILLKAWTECGLVWSFIDFRKMTLRYRTAMPYVAKMIDRSPALYNVFLDGSNLDRQLREKIFARLENRQDDPDKHDRITYVNLQGCRDIDLSEKADFRYFLEGCPSSTEHPLRFIFDGATFTTPIVKERESHWAIELFAILKSKQTEKLSFASARPPIGKTLEANFDFQEVCRSMGVSTIPGLRWIDFNCNGMELSRQTMCEIMPLLVPLSTKQDPMQDSTFFTAMGFKTCDTDNHVIKARLKRAAQKAFSPDGVQVTSVALQKELCALQEKSAGAQASPGKTDWIARGKEMFFNFISLFFNGDETIAFEDPYGFFEENIDVMTQHAESHDFSAGTEESSSSDSDTRTARPVSTIASHYRQGSQSTVGTEVTILPATDNKDA